jgi:hypothetical protein
MISDGLQVARQSRIANLLRVEVGDAYTHPVLHFAGAKIMQQRAPIQMPDHMASESRDMLIGTKVAGPAKSHRYWSPSLLPSFRRLRSIFAPFGSERIFLDLSRR